MCRQFRGYSAGCFVLADVDDDLLWEKNTDADDPCPIPEEMKFFYDGLRPPKTHIEQLVAVLVTLNDRGCHVLVLEW